MTRSSQYDAAINIKIEKRFNYKQSLHFYRNFGMQEAYAHSGGHLLSDHLQTVASIAAAFCVGGKLAGNSSDWARLAGLWHDLGKYRPGQNYLGQNSTVQGTCYEK